LRSGEGPVKDQIAFEVEAGTFVVSVFDAVDASRTVLRLP
jgi:hypothetical protein